MTLKVGERVVYVDRDDKQRHRATFVGYMMDCGCMRIILQPHHLPEHELIQVIDDDIVDEGVSRRYCSCQCACTGVNFVDDCQHRKEGSTC